MIKKILLTLFIISLSSNYAITDENIKKYGEPIKLRKLTNFKDLVNNPGKYKNKEVLIEGIITNVCQTKGFWIEISNGNEKLRVEFKDYSFFVPNDLKGKKVRIQGKIERREIKAEAYKEWMKEVGEPNSKIDAIKGKQKVLIFTASGVEMEGGSDFTPEQLQKIKKSTNHKH